MRKAEVVATDIVLAGGGHAHVHVMAALAMWPTAGVRVTLITRDLATPYSGMLPGVVAGSYAPEEAHIDLVRLAAITGTRLIHGEVTGLDRPNKRVLLKDRAPVGYDLVSIDVGITPALDAIPGAREHAIAVKPIGSFLARFEAMRRACAAPDGPRRITVIGGGAGGCELLLALRARLRDDAARSGRDADAFAFALATEGEILAGHNARVRAAFRRIFTANRVALHERRKVAALAPGAVLFADGSRIASDATLVTTQAAAPAWFAATGLALDAAGFIAVGPTLQSLNDPDVFAAGDCAALIETPREKAGVYAVRAGPPLARNLRLRASGKPARPWTPQQRHLALISAGPHYAVASRGPLKLEGAWLWTLKDRIDRRWMRMYQDADRLRERMALAAKAAGTPAVDPDEAMRCGGCAAKVGPDPLARALARLPPAAASDVVLGLERADDAAVLRAPVGRHLVQTVDFFRGFFDDPFVLGEIAANHALNDIFAMGGAATHALAIAVVPPGKPAKVEDELVQLLSGARRCFDREGVALVGGHSSEGERAVGFSVSGNVDPGRIVRKSGLKPGDALILTRPIGTGILFAAHMRGRARAAWIEPALAAMTRSNREAARILIDHGAGAMTDVTGFGLAGHLGEMLSASVVNAGLDLSCVPLYAGALTLAQEGIASTLLPDNLALARRLRTPADAAALALLFDPQTSGGLLAGVPAPRAAACVAALQAAGCESSCVVGHVAGAAQAARDAGLHLRGAFGSPPPRP